MATTRYFDVEPTFCICDRSQQLHHILSHVAQNKVYGPYYCHHCYQNSGDDDNTKPLTADEIIDLYEDMVQYNRQAYADADIGAPFVHPLQMRDSLGLTPIEIINIYIPLLGTYGHTKKANILHEVAKRILGLPQDYKNLAQYPILPERGCLRCACSNEFDNMKDRVCYCDLCKTTGCCYSGMHYVAQTPALSAACDEGCHA